MSNIEYQANVYGDSSEWHYEVSVTEDGFLVLKYVEEGRETFPQDVTMFPADIAENVAKAILRVVELSKEK